MVVRGAHKRIRSQITEGGGEEKRRAGKKELEG